MKIPKKIKVGGHEIDVEMVPPKDIRGPGEYSDFYHSIRLLYDSDAIESKVTETFLHEIFEVIRSKNNLEIDHTHLTVFSESLFQVLRDNKLNFSDLT